MKLIQGVLLQYVEDCKNDGGRLMEEMIEKSEVKEDECS